MAYETIIVETSDDIATITLNRPEALNALNSTLLGELVTALEEADRSDKVRCIIVTGSEKAFAAGADITEMAEKDFVEMYLGDWFGTRHATSNYSFLYTAKGVASILGGGLAAILFQQFGSWSAAFYGSATLALIAGLMAIALRKAPLPRKVVTASSRSAATA